MYEKAADERRAWIEWAGEEKWEHKGEKRVVDLERIARGDLELPKFDPSKGDAFTVYLAPSGPMTSSGLVPIPHIDCVAEVNREKRWRGAFLSALQEQRLC